jgi:hypothetical protein
LNGGIVLDYNFLLIHNVAHNNNPKRKDDQDCRGCKTSLDQRPVLKRLVA